MTKLASYSLAGRGTPILLIHGSMNSKGHWRPLADALKEDFTTIATDLTGYGKTASPKHPETHTLLAEVEVIRQTVFNATSIDEPLRIVAHSYGGAVALCYACHYPEEVKGLVLFEPMAMHLLLEFDQSNAYKEGRLLIDHIADLVARKLPQDGAQTFVDYFSGKGAFDMLSPNAQQSLSRYVHKMLLDYKTAVETDLCMADYQNIDCPICLITGQTSSNVSLPISRLLIDNLYSSHWIEVPGNHMAPISNPEVVNPAILKYLQRHEPSFQAIEVR